MSNRTPYPDLFTCSVIPLLCLLAGLQGFSQKPKGSALVRHGDTLLFMDRSACKGYTFQQHLLNENTIVAVTADKGPRTPAIMPIAIRRPFLRVQGSVQYDFLYRSYIDTPFTQHDFQQHTIQTFLQVTVKDKYPLRVNLSKRVSNSPYFKDFLDVGFRFDKHAYTKNAKQQLIDKITERYRQRPDLKQAEALLKAAIEKYNLGKTSLNAPDVLQRIIEERERKYYKEMKASQQPAPGQPEVPWDQVDGSKLYKIAGRLQQPDKDAVLKDSSYIKQVQQKQQELDSLKQHIDALQAKADSIKNKISNQLMSVRQKIYKATNTKSLLRIEAENGVAKEKTGGMERILSGIKTIGIGRSVLNYSELTAWNVSLTGANIEYNDGIYAALAVGKIDYGFRDFLGKNTRQKGQNFLMGRVGLGDIDRKAIILSAFTGRKYSYGGLVADTISDYTNIVGYAVEGILKKDDNTGMAIEVAKTTIPVTGRLAQNGSMHSLFRFGDNANLGISFKAQTLLSKTNTRVQGFYRATGRHFQSFSLFTYNTNQTAWQVNVDQPLLNNKVNIIASLRRNDFTNPFAEKTFKTSAVFKSIQVTVRVPRWPIVSAGYYPGTQLYIIDKERVRENAYYIMNASVMHHYKLSNLHMLSSLLYNRYAGKGTDSGFINYTGISYMASHAFIFPKLQLQGIYMYTNQEQMKYYTLDANGDYAVMSWLKLGAGIKYNKIMGASHYLGNSARIGLELKKLGGLQLQYERSYLPTIWQTLYPIETGRVSWFKYF